MEFIEYNDLEKRQNFQDQVPTKMERTATGSRLVAGSISAPGEFYTSESTVIRLVRLVFGRSM